MTMIFLSMAEAIENIVNGLQSAWQSIGTWDWETIKNWFVTGGGALAVGVFIKYGVPFFKNSNKPILRELGTQAETIVNLVQEIKDLRLENKTIKEGIKSTVQYLEVSADVNLSSKVLSANQKEKFTTALNTLKAFDSTFANEAVLKVEKIIEDNVITADEAIELAETNEKVKEVFGTKIADLMKK